MKLRTVKDLATDREVSGQLIYNLVDQKKIVHHRIGNRLGGIRFTHADVDTYLSQMRVGTEDEESTSAQAAPDASRQDWF